MIGEDDKTDGEGDALFPIEADVLPVADFLPGAKPKLVLVPSPTCWCTLRLDAKERTIKCTRCGKVWEAYAALEYVFEHWNRYTRNRDAIKRENESLTKTREEIRTEVKSLKAMKRRLDEAIAKLTGGKSVEAYKRDEMDKLTGRKRRAKKPST